MKDKEELLRKFIDGELSEIEEQMALHAIADDADLREMLRFERLLYHSLPEDIPGKADSFHVPDGFQAEVMKRIESVGSPAREEAEKTTDSRLSDWLQKVRRAAVEALAPRQLEFRPAYLALIMAIAYLGWSYLPGTAEDEYMAETVPATVEMVAEQDERVWIRFVYFDEEAENISVAGDFSDWDPVELTREMAGDKQIWTGMVQVTRGEHRYMFVKDGEEWVTDPLAEIQREDGFGNKNAVIYL